MRAIQRASEPPDPARDDPEASAVPLSLLRMLMEWHPDAIAVTDASQRFIAVNKAWSATLGLSETETIGRRPKDILGEIGEIVHQELMRALAGEELIKTVGTTRDGGIRQVAVAPWRDDSGQIRGVVTRFAAPEIDTAQAERRERRLALAMNMAQIYGFEVDFKSGEVIYEPARPGHAATKPIHSFEDMLGQLPESQRDVQRQAWEEHLATKKMLVREYPRTTPSGAVLWQMSAYEAVRDLDNEVVGVVGVSQVIDDRKQAELALLAEKEAAQAADRAKSEFLANISHEIRTPLNGVLALSSLLAKTSMDPAQSEMVRTIETSAQTLNALLSDILDLAKIEAGRIELDSHPFDPAELLGHIHKLFAGAADEKGLDFSCEIDPSLQGQVVGDRTRLSQILANLTSNAVKFTASGSVHLRAWAVGEGRDQRLAVSVADTGAGISEDALRRLFERFVQADGSISRLFGGTGLGAVDTYRSQRTIAAMVTIAR